MSKRTPDQILKEIHKHERRMEDGIESEILLEELEHEYAQATATMFVMICNRFVPQKEDEKPSEWDYEIFGVSDQRAFIKSNKRFRAKGKSVQITFYDMDEPLVTIQVQVNERTQLNSPSNDSGEDECIIYAFQTQKEAEECENILELQQEKTENIAVN